MNASSQPSGESPSAIEAGPWTHHEVAVNDVRLHYVEAGQGEPVVLLHGFPEFWYSWRRQLPALAEAGFRAIAPDLRGYNLSSRPAEVAAYRTTTLVKDVAELIEQTAGGQAVVVGHDWGGVLAWRLAALYPQRVRKLAILNAPHPTRFRDELKRNPGQWLRSSYVLFFQLPGLPEWMAQAGNFALLERTLRQQPVHPESFTPEDIAAYKQALSGPRGLTAPLNYYRAAMRYPEDLYDPPQSVAAPTMVIWGCRDPYLNEQLTEGLTRWAPDLRVVCLAQASHWVQNDAPQEVNRLLIDFARE